MQRGRKTQFEGVALAAEAILPGQERPRPPGHLTQREMEIWQDYVDGMPVGWIGREARSMLQLLCRHMVIAENLTEELVEMPAMATTARARGAILKMIEQESKIINNLAWQLRLTPKSRAEVHRKDETGAQVARKPWEYEAA